ncbi:type II toxin-antitoxin system HicB family antitoxin [Desulfolutivibrio sulfodismutans]|uniref:type II toxin-antitoxin system HicB family antitoxin n=1 Tax=Desulfolutivibrio sulfodismutans TaxID=63561 RepID=UPI001FE510B6|nr:type II toxin-antitoxin system HicB family antitoxin [Desulfolutivibrio sulfodismutans]
MTYKGYAARIEYSDEDECFVGHIAGITDIVGFHGDSVQDMRAQFHAAVDHYLEACQARGAAPNKPSSGKR